MPHPERLDLAALAEPFRYRVRRDGEGHPVISGRLGQIEPHDGGWLAVYTDRPRLIARLWAVPGVRRWQVGDQEARALVPVDALPQVAALIRARRRRQLTPRRPETSARDGVQRDFGALGARLAPRAAFLLGSGLPCPPENAGPPSSGGSGGHRDAYPGRPALTRIGRTF